MVGDRGRLPAPVTRVFGRGSEAAALGELLGRERMVTLVGAPGCGKTRLAVEVARGLPPDEVRFVDLSATADAVLLAGTLAAAVGVHEDPGAPTEAALAAGLRAAGAVLLVVDNCEHLVDEVGGLVARLVAACPHLRVLATSRVALGLAGERVWQVPPLSPGAAVDLFADRAALAARDFRLDAGNRPAVEDVCARLDGLPLAIELVAVWVRVLSPGQIAERLSGALALLSTSARRGDGRHGTMEATVGWSYRQLGPVERRLFACLAVFAGSFDLEAATAVAGPTEDGGAADEGAAAAGPGGVLGGVATLVDHSLVATVPATTAGGGPRRYRLLEPVRQCAAALLAAGDEANAVHRRHAEHYLAIAGRFDGLAMAGSDHAQHLPRLRQEEGNLQAALDWARAHAPDLMPRLVDLFGVVWEYGEGVNDGRAWFEGLLAAGSLPPELHVRAAFWVGRLAWRQGDYAAASRFLGETASALAPFESAQASSYLLQVRAIVAVSMGDTAAARSLCDESVALARECGATAVMIGTLIVSGWARYVDGDHHRGDGDIRLAMALPVVPGGDDSERDSASVLAQGHFALQYGAFLAGDPARQRHHLAAALDAMGRGGLLDRSDWLGCAAALAVSERRYHAALRLVGGTRGFRRRGGSWHPDALASPLRHHVAQAVRRVSPALVAELMAEGARLAWRELADQALFEPAGTAAPLTSREAQVAALVAEGMTNAEVAVKLSISRRTVDAHLDHIRHKLGLSSRRQITAWALRESAGTPVD